MGPTFSPLAQPKRASTRTHSAQVERREPASKLAQEAPAAAKSADEWQPDKTAKQVALEKTVESLAFDMATLRNVSPADFAGSLASVLHTRSAPMLLLRADKLQAIGKLPVYADVEHDLVNVRELDMGNDICVFVSHRWWRPGVPDTDRHDKIGIVLGTLQKQYPAKMKNKQVYIWWDFYSICQDNASHGALHDANKSAQILAIPFYLAAVDVTIALVGGDDDAYAAGEAAASSGHYSNRVWTMLELFGFTSAFAEECTTLRQSVVKGGAPGRKLIEVEMEFCEKGAKGLRATSLVADGRLVHHQNQLHETPGWTLPPAENLFDISDQQFIEARLDQTKQNRVLLSASARS